MLLSWLSRILASFLVSFLFLSAFSFVLSQTVFSPPYLRYQLQATNAYEKLTTEINRQIVQSNNNPSMNGVAIPNNELSAQLESIITPAVIQQKLDATINETQAYYDGNGPLPTLDISNQAAQLQAAGLQLPSGTDYSKPIELKPLSKLKGTKKLVNTSVFAGVGSMVLLLAGIVAIAVKRKNYKPLANIFISLSLMLGMTGITLLLVPQITDHFVQSGSTNGLAVLARDLANNITHDVGKRLLIIGVISLVIGITGRLLLRRFTPKPQLAQPLIDAPNTQNMPIRTHNEIADEPPVSVPTAASKHEQ